MLEEVGPVHPFGCLDLIPVVVPGLSVLFMDGVVKDGTKCIGCIT